MCCYTAGYRSFLGLDLGSCNGALKSLPDPPQALPFWSSNEWLDEPRCGGLKGLAPKVAEIQGCGSLLSHPCKGDQLLFQQELVLATWSIRFFSWATLEIELLFFATSHGVYFRNWVWLSGCSKPCQNQASRCRKKKHSSQFQGSTIRRFAHDEIVQGSAKELKQKTCSISKYSSSIKRLWFWTGATEAILPHCPAWALQFNKLKLSYNMACLRLISLNCFEFGQPVEPHWKVCQPCHEARSQIS